MTAAAGTGCHEATREVQGAMIDRQEYRAIEAAATRDERSMRVMEYALALVALVAAVLLAIR